MVISMFNKIPFQILFDQFYMKRKKKTSLACFFSPGKGDVKMSVFKYHTTSIQSGFFMSRTVLINFYFSLTYAWRSRVHPCACCPCVKIHRKPRNDSPRIFVKFSGRKLAIASGSKTVFGKK